MTKQNQISIPRVLSAVMLMSLSACSSHFSAIGTGSQIANSTSLPPIISATPNPTPTATSTPATLAAGFYVSPTGNDSNNGTLASPFATLAKAQAAMRASSSVKITYLRAGDYSPASINNCSDNGLSCGISISSADNGEKWSYYPDDGYNSARISGGSTAAGNGLFSIFYLSSESNVTFDGLVFHNFQYAAINSSGGSKDLTIKNNIFYNGFYVPGQYSNPGAIALYGTARAQILNNVIHDLASWGVDVANVNGDISGLTVSGNFIYNTCTALADCSAIYLVDASATAKNITWSGNYVRDGNTFAGAGSGYGSALYADDCASNIQAKGNIIAGQNGSNTIHIHGGSNNVFSGNLTDLGTYKQNIANFQTSDLSGCADHKMSGNTLEHNIIVSAGGGGGYGLLSGTPLNSPLIQNNAYYSYGNSAITDNDDYQDSAPVTENPSLSGWNYTIASASLVYSAPVSFSPLPSQWGPPGYVIPQVGSAPSSNK